MLNQYGAKFEHVLIPLVKYLQAFNSINNVCTSLAVVLSCQGHHHVLSSLCSNKTKSIFVPHFNYLLINSY